MVKETEEETGERRGRSPISIHRKSRERVEKAPEIAMPKHRAIPWSNCFAFPRQV
jgi:hypothetical protein